MRCSLSWGSWQIRSWPVGWRRMGSGAWHFFTGSHCLSLVRLSSRSHAPPLQVPRDSAFSCSARAKALDDEIDRAFPLQGCSAGTLNASLSLASQTPSPPGERTPWAGAGQQVHAWCKLAGVLSLVSFLFCKVVGFLFIRRVGQS